LSSGIGLDILLSSFCAYGFSEYRKESSFVEATYTYILKAFRDTIFVLELNGIVFLMLKKLRAGNQEILRLKEVAHILCLIIDGNLWLLTFSTR
jgi:hypothetical protein